MEKVFALKMSINTHVLIYTAIEFRNTGKDIMNQKDCNLLLQILNLIMMLLKQTVRMIMHSCLNLHS